jgi:DNA polymerase III epsilon subunit-like protein
MKKIFMNLEFTGLHQNTTIISLALIDLDGRSFYAKFSDYDKVQLTDWVWANVIGGLTIQKGRNEFYNSITGPKSDVVPRLVDWLNSFEEEIEIWGDYIAYDWVLFCELFGGVTSDQFPKCVYYIPYDISTLFRAVGVGPGISRNDFSGEQTHNQHNALTDAIIISKCYKRLEEEYKDKLRGLVL